jgi:hypothetical protein
MTVQAHELTKEGLPGGTDMTIQAHELTKDYQYGFHDVDISVFRTEKGLSPEVVAAISKPQSTD